MIKRFYDQLEKYLKPHKVLIIYGPRRVGKTTLLEAYLKRTKLKYKLDSGDNLITRQILSSEDFGQIGSYLSGYELLAIDEAQQIPKIGQALKIIIDKFPKTKVIATGSSSFDLAKQIGEPLTGRKQTLTLFPLAQLELTNDKNNFELEQNLADYLIFGSYPEVLTATSKSEKIKILDELASSYLFKDILAFDRISNSKLLYDLIRLIAFQIGNLVSLNELSTQLGVDVKTVGRYLDLLEKGFVIFSLGGYSGNLRNEITGKKKYYFFDTGIRNAVISQYNPLETRNDLGALFENFIVAERLKKRSYFDDWSQFFFWRTYEGQEIDLVEEKDGRLAGYEIKWSASGNAKKPALWKYPKASFDVINRENYLDFILDHGRKRLPEAEKRELDQAIDRQEAKKKL